MKKLIYRLIEKLFPTTISVDKINKAQKSQYIEETINFKKLENDYLPYINESALARDYKNICYDMQKAETEQEYNSIVSLLKENVNYDTFKEKEEVLKKIYEDGVYICNLLKPLQSMGIEVTVDVVGGAVRDFLLNKPIKDIDIMISFSESETKKVSESVMLNAGFTQEEINLIDWQYFKETNQTAKCKIIQLCIIKGQRENALMLSHLKKANREYEEIIDRLQGVIKVEKINTHYKIDLLITDLIKPHFMDLFDYNICKASFCFKNSHYNKDVPKDHMQLVSRCVTGVPFFNDVFNKTISVSLLNKSEADIKNSIDKHLPRIESKYSDYKVSFAHKKPIELMQFAQAYYEKFKLTNSVAIPESKLEKVKSFKI